MGSDFQKLVGSARLGFIGLVESEFLRSPELPANIDDLQKYFRQEVVDGPNRAPSEESKDEDEEQIYCTIRCRVWVDPAEEGENVSPEHSYDSAKMKISASYIICFEATDSTSLSDEAVEKFCETIGAMAVWPYFRAHSSHCASEAVVALPTLPLKKATYPIKETNPGRSFREVLDKPETA